MKKVKLFCIPYAGGSSSIYLSWKKYFKEEIEIYPVELAGRGKRFDEKPYTNMEDILNDIYNSIKDDINDGEYMIFGHSMGALLAYELIHMINENGDNKPKHAFFSGKGAQHIPVLKESIYKLSDHEFMKKVYSLGGTSKELLDTKELLEIFIGVLKADYEAIDKYEYHDRRYKFEFPISILNGIEDKLTKDCISEWSIHTEKECNIYNFPGGHFFINNNIKEISEIIKSKI